MEKLNCSKVKDLLNICLDNKLKEDDRILIENHIKECKKCSFEHNLLLKIENVLKSAERISAPEYLKERILSQIFPVYESMKEKIEIGLLSTIWAIVSIIAAIIYIPFEKLSSFISELLPKFNNNIFYYDSEFEIKVKEVISLLTGTELSYQIGFVFILLVISITIFSVEFILYYRDH